MSVWVLARRAGRDRDGPLYEYYCSRRREHVTPWAADADHFHDASAAYECASTHRELRNSEEWRAIRLTDRTNSGRGA